MIAYPRFEPTTFWPYDREFRRSQLSIRYGDRNYDCSIAGLGTGKSQRYFASDFGRLSDRLFDAGEMAVVEVVDTSLAFSSAVLHALSRYSNAVPALGKIDEGEIHEEARIVSTS